MEGRASAKAALLPLCGQLLGRLERELDVALLVGEDRLGHDDPVLGEPAVKERDVRGRELERGDEREGGGTRGGEADERGGLRVDGAVAPVLR